MSRRDRASRTSLLVRNLPLDVRPDAVRYKFERYGEIRDVYLPRDYYTHRPKGFGFIEYFDERDAEDAMYAMDGKLFGGREIAVVMSKDSRKTPRDMMVRDETTGRPHPSRGRDRSRSRSPRGRRGRSRSRSRSRGHSRRERSYSRSRSRSARPAHSRSPRPDTRRDEELKDAAPEASPVPSPARLSRSRSPEALADAKASPRSDR